jgi:hypothetical protein
MKSFGVFIISLVIVGTAALPAIAQNGNIQGVELQSVVCHNNSAANAVTGILLGNGEFDCSNLPHNPQDQVSIVLFGTADPTRVQNGTVQSIELQSVVCLNNSAANAVAGILLGNGEFDCSNLPHNPQDQVSIVLFGSAASGNIDRIWLHVRYMGNAVQSLCFAIELIPTAHMILIDASGNQLTIEPFGCIDMGPVTPCAPSPPFGERYMREFSAWEIDQVTRTPPTQEAQGETLDHDYTGVDALGNPRTLPAWYSVDLPAGFRPVQYVAGCSIYLPFDIPGPE